MLSLCGVMAYLIGGLLHSKWRYGTSNSTLYEYYGLLIMKTIKRIAYVLLVVGTAGLLVNEFATHWGTTATIVFAILNSIGLVSLAFAYWIRRKTQS